MSAAIVFIGIILLVGLLIVRADDKLYEKEKREARMMQAPKN